jgi:hypothetical protein
MASDSEPNHRWVLEHFGLKNQHFAADGFLPAIFAFFMYSFRNAQALYLLFYYCNLPKPFNPP